MVPPESTPAADNLAYEARLRERLKLLGPLLENGTLVVPHEVAEDFARIRKLPSGDIDLATVSDTIRSLSLAVPMLEARQEARDINLI